MTIKVVSPIGEIFKSEDVKSVTAPTTSGVITVLADHEPVISLLATGEVAIVGQDDVENGIAVSSGVIKVRRNEISILADTAETAENIDLDRAEAARKRAEQNLKDFAGQTDVDTLMIQAEIEMELARERVARKYRNLPSSRP